MSNETKETVPAPTEAELRASGPVAQSPEEAEKMRAEAKAKNKKAKSKAAPCTAGALRAIGLAACQRHGLKCVWVTDDGQCFDQENNARAHSKNLGNLQPLKVEA